MKWVENFSSCGLVSPHLWEYAVGTLQTSAGDAARIDAHLSRCPKCRKEFDDFRTAASALAVYASAPETGIPPRDPSWAGIQARLVNTEAEKSGSVAGASRLGVRRTTPAFVGAAASLGLCTAICAAAIPWALADRQARQEQETLQRTAPAPVSAVRSAAVETRGTDIPVVPTATNAPVEMRVRPAFTAATTEYGGTGFRARGTYPLIVRLLNHTGQETKARISVVDSGALAARRYEREVLITADPKPQTVMLYPSVDDGFNPRTELEVALRGQFPTQAARISYGNYYEGAVTMALIGDAGSGPLVPKLQVMREHQKEINKLRAVNRPYLGYGGSSVRPEDAPERPAGYDSIDTLVLSHGAERLSAPQKAALRQWVIGGGSVILLPGAGLELLGMSPDTSFKKVRPVSRLLPPETPLQRRALGMGTVLTVGVDLAQPGYRERWELPYVWNDLRNRAAPIIVPANEREGRLYASPSREMRYNDPFEVALPPLATVVYLFAGYFVLAVPVTFIVLKRTRRMNWAWVTGPTLAAVFGGAVYGFTADLHKAKLSRRTTGILLSTAGEKKARFVGTSELFFPTAGRYDVTVPGAETIDLGSASFYPSFDGNNTYQQRREQGGGIIPRSLDTIDDGLSVSVPALNVPNLAFRRLNHAQPVDWGDGITADLKLTADGKVSGTIRNGTGRTLTNTYILLQTNTRRTEIRNKRRYTRSLRNIVLVGRVAPGVTRLDGKTAELDPVGGFGRVLGSDTMIYSSHLFASAGAPPVLVATTSGETLGPTAGRYVGSSDSVTVGVALPPIESAAGTGVKGGLK